MLHIINYHFCRDEEHINGGLTLAFTLSPSLWAFIWKLFRNDPRKLDAWKRALITMGKHLPFVNLVTHVRLDWDMFNMEFYAAYEASTDEDKTYCEHNAKITKGKLQTFKMNEAFFESLPQVSQMCI